MMKQIDLSKTALGIELGSTRIKAVLLDESYLPIASGSYTWENQFIDGVWTYALSDVETGLQTCFAELKEDFEQKYTQKLTKNSSSGKSGTAGFADLAMTAMFIGLVSTYIGRYIGGFISETGLFTFHGDIIPLVVMVVSALVMGIFVFLSEKKKLGWVDSFSIAGSMIAGMTAAVIVGLI